MLFQGAPNGPFRLDSPKTSNSGPDLVPASWRAHRDFSRFGVLLLAFPPGLTLLSLTAGGHKLLRLPSRTPATPIPAGCLISYCTNRTNDCGCHIGTSSSSMTAKEAAKAAAKERRQERWLRFRWYAAAIGALLLS